MSPIIIDIDEIKIFQSIYVKYNLIIFKKYDKRSNTFILQSCRKRK